MSENPFAKFGHPHALVKEYEHWLLLCAERQATLGCFLLVCKEDVRAFSKVTEQGFRELHQVLREVEGSLGKLFQNDKINYLMLMMGNPEVHFYIIPRYAAEREFGEIKFYDKGWPGAPDTSFTHEINTETFQKLVLFLRDAFSHAN